MKITVHQLTKIAEEFLKKEYDMELTVPIRFNGRLKTALGRAKFTRRGSFSDYKPERIELSKNLIANYTDEEIVDVLKHELVHYACFMLGKPYDDGEKYFENELKRLGVVGTGVLKYKGKMHVYACNQCKQTVAQRARKTSKYNRYRTGCCKGAIVYAGTKIAKGEVIYE
jgi:SprT-like protein